VSDAAANTVREPLAGAAAVDVVGTAVVLLGALVVGVVLEPPVDRVVVVVTPALGEVVVVDDGVVVVVDRPVVVVVADEFACFLEGLAEGVADPHAAATNAIAATSKPTCDRRTIISLPRCNVVTAVKRWRQNAP
jgi:hypothetical protein